MRVGQDLARTSGEPLEKKAPLRIAADLGGEGGPLCGVGPRGGAATFALDLGFAGGRWGGRPKGEEANLGLGRRPPKGVLDPPAEAETLEEGHWNGCPPLAWRPAFKEGGDVRWRGEDLELEFAVLGVGGEAEKLDSPRGVAGGFLGWVLEGTPICAQFLLEKGPHPGQGISTGIPKLKGQAPAGQEGDLGDPEPGIRVFAVEEKGLFLGGEIRMAGKEEERADKVEGESEAPLGIAVREEGLAVFSPKVDSDVHSGDGAFEKVSNLADQPSLAFLWEGGRRPGSRVF